MANRRQQGMESSAKMEKWASWRRESEPWSGDCAEKSDGCGNVNDSPFGNLDLGEEAGQRNNHAVEEEGDVVSYHSPSKEEVVEHEELLHHGHFLRHKSEKI